MRSRICLEVFRLASDSVSRIYSIFNAAIRPACVALNFVLTPSGLACVPFVWTRPSDVAIENNLLDLCASCRLSWESNDVFAHLRDVGDI